MSNLIKEETFGLELYNRFPEMYKKDDEGTGYALKRYMQAAGEGFKCAFEELNGIPDLIDPLKIPGEYLVLMFYSYGMEIFNGVPEPFLRNMIPIIGDLFSRKGSISTLVFLTSLVSGVETTLEYSNFAEDHTLHVDLFIDYDKVGNSFPSQEQLVRIMNEFLPFYCRALIHYTFYYEDDLKLSIYELFIGDGFLSKHYSFDNEIDPEDDSDYKREYVDEADYEETHVTGTGSAESENTGFFAGQGENSCFLNNMRCRLSDNFYLNSVTGYDKIIVNGEVTYRGLN